MSCHKPGGNSAVSSIACALTVTSSDEVSRIFHRLKSEESISESVPSSQDLGIWFDKQSMRIRSEPSLSAIRKEKILARIEVAKKQIEDGILPDKATWHTWNNLEAECELSSVKMPAIYYHGTPGYNLASIIKENHIYPSAGDDVTAGASGIYLAEKESAENYGVLLHIAVSPDIEIAGDIVEDAELEEIRSTYQIVTDDDYYDEDAREELFDSMDISSVDESLAADVSEVLEQEGFGGHFDSIVEKGDLVIYDPENITIMGATINGNYLSLEELRLIPKEEMDKLIGNSH
jgi:hypothetical protein